MSSALLVWYHVSCYEDAMSKKCPQVKTSPYIGAILTILKFPGDMTNSMKSRVLPDSFPCKPEMEFFYVAFIIEMMSLYVLLSENKY